MRSFLERAEMFYFFSPNSAMEVELQCPQPLSIPIWGFSLVELTSPKCFLFSTPWNCVPLLIAPGPYSRREELREVLGTARQRGEAEEVAK